jgi:DNA polymerase III subunit epsilon
MKFAIIDLETTGLNPARDKVTEIGIVIVEHGCITEHFSCLVNPEVNIPPKITLLTGISNSMVSEAVTFSEVALTVEKLTADAIVVGHHVNFDYSFLRNEMNCSGYPFVRKTICTAELCRYLYSDLSSFSLSSLCRHFQIINSRPHRALPDAEATAAIFIKLLSQMEEGFVERLFQRSNGSSLIPGHLKNTIYNKLPSVPGVYYFIGNDGKPFYIGKAAKIKSRVLSHFRGEGNSLNILALGSRIKEIRFRETGNEMLAMLLEDHEIRHYWPRLNSAQKNTSARFGIVIYRDHADNWRMSIAKSGKLHCFVAWFHQYHLAVEFIRDKVLQYSLNGLYCGLPGNEDDQHDDHNHNFNKMIRDINELKKIEVYTNRGREEGEKGYIWIENGQYKGFGFVNESEDLCEKTLLENLILCRSSVTSEGIVRKVMQSEIPEFTFQLKASSSKSDPALVEI